MAASTRERVAATLSSAEVSAIRFWMRAARSRFWVSLSRSWHQSKTSASWRRSSPEPSAHCDGLFAGRPVAGDAIVERLGEGRLGHRGAAGNERLQLLPARRRALALARQQAEPRGTRAAGADARSPRSPGRPRRVCAEAGTRAASARMAAARILGHIPSDCVIATQRLARPTTPAFCAVHKIFDSKWVEPIDTWLDDCYL